MICQQVEFWNKTEHAVQSYAAGKTSKIAMLMEEMLMLSNANANQC